MSNIKWNKELLRKYTPLFELFGVVVENYTIITISDVMMQQLLQAVGSPLTPEQRMGLKTTVHRVPGIQYCTPSPHSPKEAWAPVVLANERGMYLFGKHLECPINEKEAAALYTLLTGKEL